MPSIHYVHQILINRNFIYADHDNAHGQNAIDSSLIGLRGSFDTLAISSLANIICMHQKIPR